MVHVVVVAADLPQADRLFRFDCHVDRGEVDDVGPFVLKRTFAKTKKKHQKKMFLCNDFLDLQSPA